MLDEVPKTNSESQNPSGIWQGRWAKQLDIIIFHFSNFSVSAAWNALEDFKTILPPDCEKDIEEIFKKTKAIVCKTLIVSTVTFYGQRAVNRYRDNVILPAERELLTAIKRSLFDRGWINKDSSFGVDANGESKTF
jgi:hypothetical protein